MNVAAIADGDLGAILQIKTPETLQVAFYVLHFRPVQTIRENPNTIYPYRVLARAESM